MKYHFPRMIYFRAAHIYKYLIVLFFAIFCFTALFFNWETSDRTVVLETIERVIKNEASGLACKMPNLPVFSEEIMKFVRQVPAINCSKAGTDWVICEGSECNVRDEIPLTHGPVKCSFTDILRVDDNNWRYGQTTNSDSYYKLQKSDVVDVFCHSANAQWSSLLTGVRHSKQI